MFGYTEQSTHTVSNYSGTNELKKPSFHILKVTQEKWRQNAYKQ